MCSCYATPPGQTSYQLLADTAVAAARGLARPVDGLDRPLLEESGFRVEAYERLESWEPYMRAQAW